MTPEQRAARLRADCYPSGICDDDTLEAVTTAAASPAEAAMLKAIDLGHRKAAVARIRNATKALKGLIAASEGGRHDTTQPGNFEGCMKRFMMAKAAREKLDNFGSYALTLPARTAQG